MAFPIIFFIILAAIIVFVTIAAVCLRIYKKNMNERLKEGNEMPYKVLIITAILILIVTTVISYFAGYKTAYDRMEDGQPAQSAGENDEQQTFYAEITEITGSLEDGNSVSVSGLAVNDINFRGEFSFAVFGKTFT